jgi:undecaprenyl-diphosphatase
LALWFAAVLGLVQGLTEFIPVSSTAHLRIAPALLGQTDPGSAFSAVIQLGTLVAVVVYFARDLFVDMPRAMLRDRQSASGRMPLYIVLGSVPIVICGVAFKDFITGGARSLWVVAGALIAVGLAMVGAERLARRDRAIETAALVDALAIGAAQALALVPGVSRSGATIACALLLGFRRSDAARFSFILGIPAIAGAGLFELRDAIDGLGDSAIAPLVVVTLTAAVSGYLSIAWLLRFLGNHSLGWFAGYRIALGAVLITLCGLEILAP